MKKSFFLFAVLVSLATIVGAQDIKCGINNNAKCPKNLCCSGTGFCGDTAEFCTVGCDPKFGRCDKMPIVTKCGVKTGAPCNPGECCSKDGRCGKTEEFCGAGCNPKYGKCKNTSEDGTCGAAKGLSCPSGSCCSKFGFCGTTEPNCNDNCDPKYGRCNGIGGAGFKPGAVHGTCQLPGTFAMTFDDGPSPYTAKMLESIGDNKVTLFMNGNNRACIYDYADVVLKAKNAGHLVAAHTWSHPHLPLQTDQELRYQFLKLNEAFYKITGCRPKYMRPPFGELNQRVIDLSRNLDMQMIIWDVDSTDSLAKTTLKSQETVIKDFVAKNPSPAPHIILGHDRIQQTTEKLSFFMLDEIKKGGWQQMTVGECFNDAPNNWYVCDKQPTSRDDTWKCDPNDRSLATGGKLEFEVSQLILDGKAKTYLEAQKIINDRDCGKENPKECKTKPKESGSKDGNQSQAAMVPQDDGKIKANLLT